MADREEIEEREDLYMMIRVFQMGLVCYHRRIV